MNKIIFHLVFAGAIFRECSHGQLELISVPEITKNPNEHIAFAGVLKFQTNKPVAAKF